MFKSKYNKVLFFIFLLALLLRVFKLGSFPIGFHADEVRVAWNSLSILQTGKDDRGNTLSLYYNTFGDYRPTGIFYATIPSIAIFGRNEFAVRFPSAFFGALSIFPLFYFTKEILKKDKQAYIATLLLAVSPWHAEVSRATSEVVISSFFALTSLYFLIRAIRQGKLKYLLLSLGAIVLSYLLYHAIRLLAPPFFFIIIVFYWKSIAKEKVKKMASFAFVFVFVLTLFFSTTNEARERLSQISIFGDIDVNYQIDRLKTEGLGQGKILEKIFHPKFSVYTSRFVAEYGDYFKTDFLLGEKARPYRYTTPGAGLQTYAEFILLLAGIVAIIKSKKNFILIPLLMASPLAAALTTEDSPNLHRAFFMVIFIPMIEAYGYTFLTGFKKHKDLIKKSLLILLSINLIYFWHMYFYHATVHKPYLKDFVLDGSSYRNVGTKDLALQLEMIKGNYEKIIVTNQPDDVYPWYAFFTKKDPKEFNKFAIKRSEGPWQYENIVFSRFKCPSDDSFKIEKEEKLLVVDSGECAYQTKIKDGLPIRVVNKIFRTDGSEVYVLLERL